MILKELKNKLNDESQELLMYLPIPRTSSISMSYYINDSDKVFTCRNYDLASCYYEPTKSLPPVLKTSNNKDDWDLNNFVSLEQNFFINKLSEIQTGLYQNIFSHENKKIFTIVRHPIDRLFSIWNYCTNSLYEYELFSLSENEENYKINDFNEFVKIFASNGVPEKYPNRMFLKMSDILDVDLGENLLIYRFEELETCLDHLRVEYDIKNDYKSYNFSKISTEKNINKETTQLIYQLYKEDFEKFEYEYEYEYTNK